MILGFKVFPIAVPHCAFCIFGRGLLFGLRSFFFSSHVPLSDVFPFLKKKIILRRLMACHKLQQVLGSFLLLWRTPGSISWKKLTNIILVLVPNSTHKQNKKSGLQVWFLKHMHLGFWVLWFGCDCLWLMFIKHFKTIFSYFLAYFMRLKPMLCV